MRRLNVLLSLAVPLVACGKVQEAPPVDSAVIDSEITPPVDSPARVCPEGTNAVCANDELVRCDQNGAEIERETCALGCNPTEGRCNRIATSNGLDQFLDEAELAPPLVLTGNATIDTDTGAISDAMGNHTPPTSTLTAGLPVPVFVVKVSSLDAGNVTVTGSRALAIVSFGPVTISGRFSVSAQGGTHGPGALVADTGCRGGNAGAGNQNGKAGGGGGGFGTAGARGGSGGVPSVAGGLGGGASGTLELVPLRGGCPGGRSSNAPANYAAGGGGGAIQIVSNTSITVADNGFIAANGGGGAGPINPVFCLVNVPCGFGEGGGSGGAILLEAPEVTVAATGGLVANGGGGSCSTYGSASNGQLSATPASGQTCGGDTGSGGNGAAGAIAATPGVNGSGNNPVGGGGGGGAGRIRVNVPLGTTFQPAGVISPAGTVGVLGLR